jgi:hypothetical protein
LDKAREVRAVGKESLGGKVMVDMALEALGGCVKD